MSQPSKLHKIPTAKCAQLQSKEERVGEGGGGTIHLNSKALHLHDCKIKGQDPHV